MDQFDIDKIREDLIDYYGTAMFFGIGPAAGDLAFIENATDEEIFEFAQQSGIIDLNDYKYKRR